MPADRCVATEQQTDVVYIDYATDDGLNVMSFSLTVCGACQDANTFRTAARRRFCQSLLPVAATQAYYNHRHNRHVPKTDISVTCTV